MFGFSFSPPLITIVALSLSIGIGFTTASEIELWHAFPPMIQSVFSANVVAVVFVVSIFLNLVLPKTWMWKGMSRPQSEHSAAAIP